MNWLKRPKRPPTEGEQARKHAESELQRTQADLENTKAQTGVYRELAASLRDMRQRNHFADGLLETFGKGDRK